ncbi:MAG: hypothetical protein MK171_03270 [Pirellulales bacterium]|nr:hypothetical protein [Pirellulales bacterium]
MNVVGYISKISFCFSLLGVFTTVHAATTPFTEDFSADVADWGDAGSLPLTFVGAGGPDGSSYASTDFAFSSGGGSGGSSAVLFRGHDEFGSSGSSGGAFEGNWISDGVEKVKAFVRHNAPSPLSYFARGSGPFNFPGAVAVAFAPVMPNVWTELTFDVTASSFQLVSYEGSDHGTVFSNVGHVQLGVSIPEGFDANPSSFTFDLDKVSIVPEPTTALLAGLALSMCCVRGRRRV